MTIATLVVELIVPILAWAPYPLFAYSTSTRASSSYHTDTKASAKIYHYTTTSMSDSRRSIYTSGGMGEENSGNDMMMSIALLDGSVARVVQAAR